MRQDLIMGIASSYTWRELQPFVVSLRRTGYDGRVLLLRGYGPRDPVDPHNRWFGADDETPLIPKLKQYGVEVHDMGEFMLHPILIRFPVMAEIIKSSLEDIRWVMCVDTKDIVFQSNPIPWVEEHIGGNDIVVAGENQTYSESGGNKKNAIEAYGEHAFAELAGDEVMNGGMIAGRPEPVGNLLGFIHEKNQEDLRLLPGRPAPGYQEMLPDQTALNILVRKPPFVGRTLLTGAKDGFVFEWGHCPVAEYRNGRIYPKGSGTPYVVFHQYNYNNEWTNAIRREFHE